jgi:selenoprotein W-related protein
LTAEILSTREIEYFVRSWQLIPSSGGRYEITVNGELIWSKKALGRHAELGEVKAAIVAKMEAVLGGPLPTPQAED